MIVATLDQLQGAKAVIQSLPADLTDERINKKRVWAEFMEHISKQLGVYTKTPKDTIEWMGFDFKFSMIDVRHPVFFFGAERAHSIGQMMVLTCMRGEKDRLVMARIPSKVGNSAEFVCRASSAEFADVLRIFVRSTI